MGVTSGSDIIRISCNQFAVSTPLSKAALFEEHGLREQELERRERELKERELKLEQAELVYEEWEREFAIRQVRLLEKHTLQGARDRASLSQGKSSLCTGRAEAAESFLGQQVLPYKSKVPVGTKQSLSTRQTGISQQQRSSERTRMVIAQAASSGPTEQEIQEKIRSKTKWTSCSSEEQRKRAMQSLEATKQTRACEPSVMESTKTVLRLGH